MDPRPRNFRFFTLPLKISDTAKLSPNKLHKIFLITSGNSTLFLIYPWKFLNCYFFNTPMNSISSQDVIQALFDDVISHGVLMTTFSTNPYFFIFQRFECYTTFIFRELLYNRNQFFFLLLLFQKVS